MMDETGARLQETLRTHPAFQEIANVDRLLRGTIMPNGVLFKDDAKNTTGITLVNVSLMGGYPDIYGVPVAHTKINYQTGEEWSPDPGDVVLVSFINGNFWEPVVIGYLPLPQNQIEGKRSDVPAGKRRYHFKCNKTDITVDKDGNRDTSVQGHDSLTIQTGDYTVNVVAGKCTVNVKGKTVWTSDGTVEIDGSGSGAVAGVVQGDCLCAYTGKKHPMVSSTVKVSK
ncbi:hypothetical protein [Oryzomonas rubra]|uniref:Gp5/Type VI secretion system Vgr protein OB-fold domain-containing protein n=1 Tax=Oryzomonas rubra TaxID=2509454 RepID=A0A5A9X8P2_9BACT|nr:hypothetical protein [Oryzomonas rubra]KAA0888775.1 hypothetical protein ET418_15455 [Oryzomonas rubra]